MELKRVPLRKLQRRKIIFRQYAVEVLLILLGVLTAGLGLKGFLMPSGFLDGGVTGISLLISRLTGIDLGLLIFCLNIPFILLGFRQVSLPYHLWYR